jgi:hypothetical protein
VTVTFPQNVNNITSIPPEPTEITDIAASALGDLLSLPDEVDSTVTTEMIHDTILPPNSIPEDVQEEAEDYDYQVEKTSRNASTLSRSSGSKGLLRKFYQIPSTSTPRSLRHGASMLVEHYFKDVCGIYSSFDSTLNPFRMSVARSWSNSASIYYAIQSMAAAHLANTYSSMEPIGFEMKRQANTALREELALFQSGQKTSDCALLVTLLLALSACWHETRDLGLGYIRVARMLMYPRLSQTEAKSPEVERQDQFFEEALIYCEMMMAFVTPGDNDLLSAGYASESEMANDDGLENFNTAEPLSNDQKLLPHPWTGVAPKVQMLFAEVAQLVRRERTAQPDDSSFDWIMNGARRQKIASSLEEQLLAVELPQISAVIDSGDETTSKQDFIIIAEATRCAALLEIYRVFPDNLPRRLGVPSNGFQNLPFGFGDGWSAATYKRTEDTTGFLNSLALHIIDLIAKLPTNSGTRFLQLMLLVVAASELRYVDAAINLDFLDLGSENSRIMIARLFAEERLGNHAIKLAAKPVRLMIKLIKEVWRRLDLGEDVFWLDIMIANGWETVLG